MTIHWWNTDKVVEKLADDRVSEDEAVRYAMIGAVLYSQGMYFALWLGGYRGWFLIYEFLVVTIIALVGVVECFKANGGAQGVDFLKRLSVISVPIGIKVTLVGTVLAQIGYFGFPYIITPLSFRNPAFVYDLYSFVFASAVMFIYYWRIATHLSCVSRRERSNPAVQGPLRDEAAQRP